MINLNLSVDIFNSTLYQWLIYIYYRSPFTSSTELMLRKRPFLLLATLMLVLYTCFSIKLSFVDKIKSNSVLINSISSTGSNMIWLDEVSEQSNGSSLKVFLRSQLQDYSKPIPYQTKLEDPQDDLQLKAWEEQNLKCAIFYTKSEDRYFLHIFPQEGQEQQDRIYFDQYMTEYEGLYTNAQRTFKLSKYCDTVLVDGQQLFVYAYYSEYYYDWYTDYSYDGRYWNWAASFSQLNGTVSASDNLLTLFYINGDIYRILFEVKQDYQEGDDQFWYYQGLIYQQYTVAFLTSVEVTGYKLLLESYIVNYGETFLFDYEQRILIFGEKKNTKSYSYVLIAIYTDEEFSTNMVTFIEDESQTDPNIVYSPDTTNVIIYGTNLQGKPFYLGYYINYLQNSIAQMTFPSSIANYKCFLSITHHFLYARTTESYNNKYNQSAYALVNQYIYAYFQQKVIEDVSYSNNWVKSYVELIYTTTFLKAEMQVLHLHQISDRHYFRWQIIDSFQTREKKEKENFVDWYFSIEEEVNNENQHPLIVGAKSGFRWIYALQDVYSTNDSDTYATVKVKSYDREKRQNTTLQIQIQSKKEFNFTSFMVSPNLGCFSIKNTQNRELNVYKVNEAQIKFVGSIGSTLFNNGTLPASQKDIKLTQTCQIIFAKDRMFFLSNSSDPSIYETRDVSPLDPKKASFDPTYTYAVEGSDVYKFNGQTFDKLFSESFKKSSQLVVSADGNKIVVRTNQNVRETKTNETNNKTYEESYYAYDLQIFHKTTDGWSQIKYEKKLPSVKITSAASEIQTSTNFQKVLFCYVLNTTSAERVCTLTVIDYASKKAYESSFEFKSGRMPKIEQILENYIFIMDSAQVSRNKTSFTYDCKENIFQIDKSNNSIRLLLSVGVECLLYQDNFMKRIINENVTTKEFYFVIEFINSLNVSMVKTALTTVDKLKGSLAFRGINSGFFQSNGTYLKCTPGCLNCDNFYLCTKCMNGYVLSLDNYKCKKCGGYCETCHANNLTKCITCPLGYFYNTKTDTCVKCHALCETCSGRTSDKCTSCQIGSFLNNNIEKRKRKTCIACPSNCDYCKNSTQCTTCQYGFSLASNGTCVKCPLDCNGCDPNEVIKCLACRSGFELVTIEGKIQCQKCPSKCDTCIEGKCTKCRKGYNLNIDKNVCSEPCWAPCKQCSISSPYECSSCMPGYKLNVVTCEPDISCSATQSCISCPSGYSLIAKKCQKCAISQGCSECHSDQPIMCVSCDKGYFLMGQDCETCKTDDCVRCYSQSICQQCKEGYLLSQLNSTASLCVKCASICKTCIESVTNCQSCYEDYKLTGTSCVSTRSVVFTLKLNLDIDKFTNDIYIQLIQEIARITNKTASQIHILSFKNGSTSVQGSLDVKDAKDQKTALSSLNQALASGTQLAGQEVLNSQFVGYSPVLQTAPAAQEKSNMVLILAASIPGALIVVGLIVLILYKKYFAPNEQINADNNSDRSSTDSDVSEKQRQKQADKKPVKARKDLFSKKVERRPAGSAANILSQNPPV